MTRYSEEIRAEETKLKEESRSTRTRYNTALEAEGDDATAAGSQFGAGGSSEIGRTVSWSGAGTSAV